MRKVILPLLIIMCLVLTACSDKAQDGFNEFIAKTQSAQTLSFNAEVRAEFAEKTADFTLHYTKNDEGQTVEIVKPDIIRGIKAHIAPETNTLEYDGAILDIGKLTDTGLSPMSALPLVTESVLKGHIDIAWSENELLCARLIPSDNYSVTISLNADLVPVSAEVNYKEKTVVFVKISDWESSGE